MYWEIVGERIKSLRMKHNLSRVQFGKMIDISGQYLGLVEKGKCGLSVGSIVKICKTTGASADYLLFGVDTLQDQAIDVIKELSNEQLDIVLDIVKQVVRFVNSKDGNEVLIREMLRQYIVSIE